jgi:hypothetical protein
MAHAETNAATAVTRSANVKVRHPAASKVAATETGSTETSASSAVKTTATKPAAAAATAAACPPRLREGNRRDAH